MRKIMSKKLMSLSLFLVMVALVGVAVSVDNSNNPKVKQFLDQPLSVFQQSPMKAVKNAVEQPIKKIAPNALKSAALVAADLTKLKTNVTLSANEASMIKMINNERSKQNLDPLKMDPKLVQIARIKSADMLARNYFGHSSPTYGLPYEMLRRAGLSFKEVGENIASHPTVVAAHNALMNSTAHRENILSPKFTHVGVGIVPGGKYGLMITQLFAQESSDASDNTK